MWVVVTAAGSGKRMGGLNKLLLELEGVPILVRSLQVFERAPDILGVAVSAPPTEVEAYRQLFDRWALARVRWVVPGGAERQDSIRHALEQLPAQPDDAVAIHDAARPLVSAELLERLRGGLPGCDGVLPMVAVKDTIKVVRQGKVERTLDRAQLFAAQTPQVFAYGAILNAHREAQRQGYLGTDDASLIEWLGGEVRMVEGDYTNLKITTPDDLELARQQSNGALLRRAPSPPSVPPGGET